MWKLTLDVFIYLLNHNFLNPGQTPTLLPESESTLSFQKSVCVSLVTVILNCLHILEF